MSFFRQCVPTVLPYVVALGLVLPVGVQAQGGADVRVMGVVRDDFNGISLPGVPVEVVGTDQVVYTDVDGHYSLSLAPGMHDIRVVLDGYAEQMFKLDVPSNQRSMAVDVNMATNAFSETVTVVGTADVVELSTSEGQLQVRQRSSVISDNLPAEEMKQNADSNAASAMTRVTGVSVGSDSFVFVRGLGERYSNTTLNGSALPTTQPDKKVVPLDLFPSSVLNSVSVAKSYTPDRSADFAGGLVEIVPLKFPNQTLFDASWEIGFNSVTTGNDFNGYRGGGSEWRASGLDARALPSSVPDRKVIRGGIYTPEVGALRSDLQTIGRDFQNNWNLLNRTAKPNQTGSLTFGTNLSNKFGVLLSYTQKYNESFVSERQVFYRTSEGGALSEFSDYDLDYAVQTANVAAVGNVSIQPTPTHRITWENFYTKLGTNETRTFSGFNSDIATDLLNQRLYYVEEGLVSSGVTGEHFFSRMANSRIDWRATFSGATRDEPDLREVLYEQNGDEFVLADESQSGLRMFNTLNDDTVDAMANWSLFGSMNGLPTQVKFGGQYIDRTRDFSSRRFRFVPVSNAGLDLTSDPESLYAAANIGPNFEIKEETRTTDTYDASQTVGSFYGMADIALSTRTRVIGGLRLENFEQLVRTFDLFAIEQSPTEIIDSVINETDVFPAVNFVFSPTTSQNLRLSFSQTVNRPEFREVAPFEFTDIVGGRAIVGNPDLKRTLIQNYDVRYEMFPAAEEVVAVSFFYKNFDNPIERVIEPTAQLRTSFTNAESARNAGIELEGRKRLSDNVLVGANYTFVDSKVTLSPEAAQVQTSLERPLEGQAANLFNALVEVRGGRTSARLLYNFFGERITDVGALGLPDIIDTGRGTLDFALTTRLFDQLSLRFAVDNLTDQDYESTQGNQLQRLYNVGRTFKFNFGYSAF